jgi:hypothetical protein
MTTVLAQQIAPPTNLTLTGIMQPDGPAQPGKWQDIVAKVSSAMKAPAVTSDGPRAGVNQLSGLLRLQMDITQYQLRVEVVSKVAESAVASLRKLQQNQ